jgi:uracil-DNA glycosylase family 4
VRIDLAALALEAAACTRCPLHASRTTSVFASGSAPARLVLLGEAPGATEDQTGRPFCGASGRLLDTALHTVGLSRESVYVLNAVKCRPPDNRPPTHLEISACSSFLLAQLTALAPAPIVALGASALRALNVPFTSLTSVRSTWVELPAPFQGRLCLPTVHPAYVLRRRRLEFEPFCADLAAAAASS